MPSDGTDANHRKDSSLALPRLSASLIFAVAALAACSGPDSLGVGLAFYPIVSSGDGVMGFEFGPGSLETTSDVAWRGSASLLYPAVLDSDAGPVDLEIYGLDLSGIEYTGDMGWPPDMSDSGAQIWASLIGSSRVAYRTWSTVGDLLDPNELVDQGLSARDFRAYAFFGYDDDVGAYGAHSLNLERWGPAGSRGPYNTVDLRLRYQRGGVAAWVRLHASREWDEGGRESGAACPWNVAINNAIPGTADSVWTGECRVVEPGETGRPVGAWVPVTGGAWTVKERLGSVQAGLSIRNWQNAHGPYRITWRNVILRGAPDLLVPSSTGRGVLRPFGTGQSEIEPRGEWAEFSYRATGMRVGVGSISLLHYRSAGFELASQATHWVRIARNEVRLGGEARVNGEGGFRYELRGVAAVGNAPDSLSLKVWTSESSVRPHYMAYGALAQGSIEIEAADDSVPR